MCLNSQIFRTIKTKIHFIAILIIATTYLLALKFLNALTLINKVSEQVYILLHFVSLTILCLIVGFCALYISSIDSSTTVTIALLVLAFIANTFFAIVFLPDLNSSFF